MDVQHIGVKRYRALRLGLLTLGSLVSFGAAAQVAPIRYQHCEVTALAPDAVHRLESNYRYPPTATIRILQGYSIYRCEPAWVQSPAIFDAFDTCAWFPSGCSAKANEDRCNDSPDDWTDYDVLGAKLWSDSFIHESAWPPNPEVKVHSGLQVVEQWTRHRHWGWDDPPRYAYLGLVQVPITNRDSSYPKCYGMAYLVGLFNGVWNTELDAENGMKAIQSDAFIGPSHQGSPIRYHLFYNRTGCGRDGVTCLEDLAEVFIQRSAELDGVLERRWEYFWEQVTGHSGTPQSFTEMLRLRVLNVDHALTLWLNALADALLAKMTALVAHMHASPPTAADTATHVETLIRLGRQGYRAVLIGHSQGNLFVNAAYDGYLAHARQAGAAAGQDTGYVAARVVHLAPASATLNGTHVLAEIDLVINGLRLVDGTPVAVNTLSRDIMPPSRLDPSGHRLIETYLDPQRRARNDIQQLIVQAMDAL